MGIKRAVVYARRRRRIPAGRQRDAQSRHRSAGLADGGGRGRMRRAGHVGIAAFADRSWHQGLQAIFRRRTRTLRVCAATSSRSPDSHGLAPIAASTHPFSSWTDQKHTEKDRYDQLTHEMQGAARRLVICGMHVHVGIDDDELRIDLMNQMSYFLPHLLALSCSSPFWHGRDTGLKSYRLTIFDALPRTACRNDLPVGPSMNATWRC